jgi:uncharacterized protein (DUF2141 family)
MRWGVFFLALIVVSTRLGLAQQPNSAPSGGHTLTVIVDGVNSDGGNVGLLVFNSAKGWAEDRTAALKDIVVPAHAGTVTIKIPDLPPGTYAVSLVHDVNQNHKLDKNFIGKPKEQWGLSNDPHAVLTAPAYSKSTFSLQENREIHIAMQM